MAIHDRRAKRQSGDEQGQADDHLARNRSTREFVASSSIVAAADDLTICCSGGTPL
jgi:hypothetical protein